MALAGLQSARKCWTWRWETPGSSLGRTAARAVRPWRKEFCEERCLPDSVRGPVECAELARLVAARGASPVFSGSGWGEALLRASQRSTGSVGVAGAWAAVAI